MAWAMGVIFKSLYGRFSNAMHRIVIFFIKILIALQVF